MSAALASITASVTDVAFVGDRFFPPEDVKADADRIPGAVFKQIGSVWGHFTMFCLREQHGAQIDDVHREALGD